MAENDSPQVNEVWMHVGDDDCWCAYHFEEDASNDKSLVRFVRADLAAPDPNIRLLWGTLDDQGRKWHQLKEHSGEFEWCGIQPCKDTLSVLNGANTKLISARLTELAAPDAAQWSKRFPVVDGWYWVRFTGYASEPEMHQVVGNECRTETSVFSGRPGHDCDQWEFLGPLQPTDRDAARQARQEGYDKGFSDGHMKRIDDVNKLLDEAGIAKDDGLGEWSVARRVRELLTITAAALRAEGKENNDT